MALRRFGSGLMFGKQPGGTPVCFGALQGVDLDFDYTNKKLYGQEIFPEAIGRGEGKLTAKAKFGRVSGNLYNSLFFGQSLTSGMTEIAYKETHSVPASSTYTITTTNAAHYVDDLGVIYADTGLPLTLVGSLTAAGQYMVDTATGIYTFDASDASADVLISYTYTVTTGYQIAVGNTLQGLAPQFQVYLSEPDPSGTGGQTGILYACVASKLSIPTKMADFGITELDIDCQADASDRVALLGMSE
jgi:hypothetical protein